MNDLFSLPGKWRTDRDTAVVDDDATEWNEGYDDALTVCASELESALQPVRELVEAAKELLRYAERQQCTHEDTERRGFNWTFCMACGKKWADDEGGFQPYVEPEEITKARNALSTLGDTK